MNELKKLDEVEIKEVYKYLLSLLGPFSSNSTNDLESESLRKKRNLRANVIEAIRNVLAKTLGSYSHHRENLWQHYQNHAGKIEN